MLVRAAKENERLRAAGMLQRKDREAAEMGGVVNPDADALQAFEAFDR